MGRPLIVKRAMTNAEKQRRYRAKKFGNSASVTKSRTKTAPDGAAELREKLAQAEKRIVELEAKSAVAAVPSAQRVEHERIRRGAEAQIDPATFSMTVQQKNEAWKRQELRRMELTFERRANDAVIKKNR